MGELNSFLLLSDLLKWNTFLVIIWCEGECLFSGGICGNHRINETHAVVGVCVRAWEQTFTAMLMDSEKARAGRCVSK